MTTVAMPQADVDWLAEARGRGLTSRGHFDAGPYSFDLTFSPSADLDSTFEAVCLDTGETLKVRGWLFTHEIEA